MTPLGLLIDTYDTLERKFFDEMPRWVYPFRVVRRLEMRAMRRYFKKAATEAYTEGYGFTARKVK